MEKKLKKIYEEALNVLVDNLSEFDGMTIDSLDLVNILFEIESKMNISIPNEDLEEFELKKVKNMYNYLIEKCADP